MGGLVTTRDAGMAVPDWPSTYGYNLFLYPWQSWLFGPWDLFIEHGHRLLGAVVGLVTIGFAFLAWRADARRWLHALAIVAIVAVIAQGVLGGLRVMQNERTLAMIHGCLGPAFFAFCAALAVVTSSWWRTVERRRVTGRGAALGRLALSVAALSYVQLVLGASIRHLPRGFTTETFRTSVLAHLFLALVLVITATALVANVLRYHRHSKPLVRAAIVLGLLFACQPVLGAAAWVTNYGWPAWAADYTWTGAYVVTAQGFSQAAVTTAHQATGSLIVAVSVVTALCAFRQLHVQPQSVAFFTFGLEAIA